ncbi:MAG: AarF/UbiB family protein [Pseudomonadota bacterium]|nr:AarF/UbiB family protein [Pseudomonadota bacterium]
MKISPQYLKRYREIGKLLWKYGRSDLVTQMDIDDDVPPEDRKPIDTSGETSPVNLADDLEAMGPTYVKLGQVLSSRPDLVPPAYIKALARLQDKVKPFPYAEVEKIVEAELGVRISKLFSRFDPEPIAGASLGQVHKAALRDGREVVVKVQRPGVPQQVAEDFEVLKEIATFLDKHTEVGRRHRFAAILEELRASIMNELNYEREAQNLVAVGKNLAGFELIQIPQPVADYSTKRVLTMDYVEGRKITKISPVARLEMDGCKLAEELFRAYLKQVLVDGLFHADPHPGNVFITDDDRIALLDLGMVGHTTPSMQTSLLKVLISISEGKAEEAADVVIQISETTKQFDATMFKKRIAQLVMERQGQALKQINVGKTLLDVTRSAAELGLYVPSDLTMLGKTLLQLDEVGRILDPDFDPDAAIRRNATEIMTKRLSKDTSKGSIFTTLLDLKEFAAGLPVRLNKIMDAVANKDLEMKVRAVDAPIIMDALHKIANRVTSGLILAALIIGASLMMRIETPWTLFGYPGLAIVTFLAAAGGGFWLVINIFVQDKRSEHRAVNS